MTFHYSLQQSAIFVSFFRAAINCCKNLRILCMCVFRTPYPSECKNGGIFVERPYSWLSKNLCQNEKISISIFHWVTLITVVAFSEADFVCAKMCDRHVFVFFTLLSPCRRRIQPKFVGISHFRVSKWLWQNWREIHDFLLCERLNFSACFAQHNSHVQKFQNSTLLCFSESCGTTAQD